MDMALAAEPTENADATQPTEPIDRIEPAEPIDRIEPDEPMDKMEPDDPMLMIDPDEPAEERSGTLRMAPLSRHAGTPRLRAGRRALSQTAGLLPAVTRGERGGSAPSARHWPGRAGAQ